MRDRIETPLKRVMDAEGRSQSWLARMVGVSRGTVQNWMFENRWHPTEANRAAVARALGRTEAELFPADDDQIAA